MLLSKRSGKKDLFEQHHIPPEKTDVIRWGSAFEAYSNPPGRSAAGSAGACHLLVYLAIIWPHKNRELILRGLRG
jgi:hypothetical protein